jgi:hypothetical protein
LTGLQVINHHTLSDFRIGYRETLDELFTQVLAWLSREGLIGLERVMHDGTKIGADAGPHSFRSEETIQKHLDVVRAQLQAMGALGEEIPPTRRETALRRTRREREQRLF